MDSWLTVVIQQITLYLLPVVVSMSVVCWVESRFTQQPIPHPFFAITSRSTWLPFFAAIFFTRGIIFSLARPLRQGLTSTFIRFLTHLALCLIGFLLYTWSLAHQPPAGLPPIHHWWAKVFMFFNLCMVGTHLLPLPNFVLGEWLLRQPSPTRQHDARWFTESRSLWLITLLAASPLMDLLLGGFMVFPIYEQMATLATHAL